MTSIEIPTQPPAPAVNPFAERLWRRLPQVYRDFDAQTDYAFLRYIDAVTQLPGGIHTVIERITGSRAVGPASPEPWSLNPEQLQLWRDARVNRPSALGDPFQADNTWLDWLAQIVGARLDVESDVTTRRNMVRYAVSGWKAGTRPSIEYAARPTLTGSQYARCVAHMRNDETAPTVWDVAIITRSSETPDPAATVATIVRAGVKPAGVVMWHRPYEASWDTLEAVRPSWDLWETDFQGVVTWDRLAETGLTFASVPGNLLLNASYETDLANWTAQANTTAMWMEGGVDGFGQAQLTAIAAGQVGIESDAVAANDGTDYRTAVSVKPTAIRTARLVMHHSTGATSIGPDAVLPADEWTRLPELIATSPVTATTIAVSVQVDGLDAAETVNVDGWDLRSYTG